MISKFRLESACSRAASAETLLAEVRQSLLEKLELLQKSLQTKICQVEELKQSRAKLIEDARILLKSVDARDWALAEANGKIKLLAELVAEPRTRAIGQVQSSRLMCCLPARSHFDLQLSYQPRPTRKPLTRCLGC